jgi:hypothetical protein
LKQYQSEYATLTKSITSETRKILGIVSKVTKLLGIAAVQQRLICIDR